MSKRPEGLVYAVDDTPPLPSLVLLGLQYAAVLCVYLILIVVVMKAGGASQAQTIDAVSLGMIAAAASTILQALRRGPIGSGFLAAPVFSAIYIGPSLLAAEKFGLAAVFGMTIFAGLVEIFVSRLLGRLRVLFPPAISGFIVLIVGVQLGLVGVEQVLDVDEYDTSQYIAHLSVSALTVAITVGMSVWAAGTARLLCSSIGILCGFCLSIAFGLVPVDSLSSAVSGPIMEVPDISHISYSFEWSLIPGFLIAGIAATLRTVGVITTCQKINEADWKRPDQKSIKGGILADGIGCVIAGALGCIGQNTSPSLVGVSKASGATSRAIAFSAGIFLLVFAFFPMIGAILLLLPKAVIGAALLFTACFMITGGIEIMVSRNIDTRMTYVTGIALLLGLSREVDKTFFKNLPHAIQPLTNTTISTAITAALILHLILRIGSRRTASIAIEDTAHSSEVLSGLIHSRGESWSLPRDVVDRAASTAVQIVTHVHDAKLVQGKTNVALSYDDLDLVITVEYSGTLLTLPNVGVRRHVFLEEESFSYGLADFLIGVYPDRMEASAHGDNVTIRLVFRV